MSRFKNVMVVSCPDMDDRNAAVRIGQIREKYQTKSQYGDRVIDFQKVLPMPAELFDSPSGENADKSYYVYTKVNHLPCDEVVVSKYDKEFKEEFKNYNFKGVDAYERFLESYARDFRNELDISVGKKLYENETKFGSRNWEAYHEKNWGTRLNALNSQEIGFDTLIFETDGMPARHIFDRIAKDNPDVVILCGAVNLDDAKDCSVYRYKNGVMDNFNIGNETCGEYLLGRWESKPFSIDDCSYTALKKAVANVDEYIKSRFVSHSTDYQILHNVLPETPLVKTEKKSLKKEQSRANDDTLGKKIGDFLDNLFERN